MENTKVVPATQDLVDYLKGKLREDDKREVWAMSGRSADEALQAGFRLSEMCWIGMWNDEPVTCFGVRRPSILSDLGIPWLLGTDKIRCVKSAFVKNSIIYVRLMAERFKDLENYVDARNTLSIKWLGWCGFEVEKTPIPYGHEKVLFHKFWYKR